MTTTKLGIVGCGFVFDHYMTTIERHPGLEIAGVTDIDRRRVQAVAAYYGVPTFANTDALIADPSIDIVVNLTSIPSHFDVTRAALDAGKHVYSEKPLVTDMAQAHELVEFAAERGVRLSCAPSNLLGATAQTMWKAVTDGAIGTPRIVYAEFDDNPIYLRGPEHWKSRSGAPWPYLHEYEMGCTYEHVGYHLSWMCAMFGPVASVTAFSKMTLPDKTDRPLSPPDTPDFSIACLDFVSGVVGRVTCSIAAPYDHRMRIIGNRGMVHADTYRHYECPVYLESFTKLSLNVRNFRAVRTGSVVQRILGVGGRRLPLARSAPPGSQGVASPARTRRDPRALLQRVRRDQVGQQDKCIGIAELADAIVTGRDHFPSPEFTLHLTELTLAIQGAGTTGAAHVMETSFDPLELPERTLHAAPDYREFATPSRVDRLLSGVLKLAASA